MMERLMERRDFKDRKLKCLDCGATFVFSDGEQTFFWSKGLAPPKRCQECRLKRKLTIVREVSNGQ